MKLYLKVSKDKYELPEAVAESPKELADMLGTSKGVVTSSISKGYKSYIRIEVEDDEEEIRSTLNDFTGGYGR